MYHIIEKVTWRIVVRVTQGGGGAAQHCEWNWKMTPKHRKLTWKKAPFYLP